MRRRDAVDLAIQLPRMARIEKAMPAIFEGRGFLERR